MKQKLTLLCLIAATGIIPHARGQSIGPDVVNATGGSGIIDGNTYEWSVGELMVTTYANPLILVTQGVLQPGASTNKVADMSVLPDVTVFPNPSSTLVNVRYGATEQGTLNCRLMDLTGKILMEQSAKITVGTATQQLDLRLLAAATYMLDVSFEGANNIVQSKSFKIQKLN